MARKFEGLILDYCGHHGIEVPPGFGRNSPSRYAIVRVDREPPRLVARTWFKTADVLHYVVTVVVPELGEQAPQALRILDFKDCVELSYILGSKRLVRSTSKFR